MWCKKAVCRAREYTSKLTLLRHSSTAMYPCGERCCALLRRRVSLRSGSLAVQTKLKVVLAHRMLAAARSIASLIQPREHSA